MSDKKELNISIEDNIYNILISETKNIGKLKTEKDKIIIKAFYKYHKGVEEITEPIDSTMIKSFINWRDKKKYQLRDINIIHSKDGLNYPYASLFEDKSNTQTVNENNYITYMSAYSAIKLGNILETKFDWNAKGNDIYHIQLPIIYHITSGIMLYYNIKYNINNSAITKSFSANTYIRNCSFSIVPVIEDMKIEYEDDDNDMYKAKIDQAVKDEFSRHCNNTYKENPLLEILKSDYLDASYAKKIENSLNSEYIIKLHPSIKRILAEKYKDYLKQQKEDDEDFFPGYGLPSHGIYRKQPPRSKSNERKVKSLSQRIASIEATKNYNDVIKNMQDKINSKETDESNTLCNNSDQID